MKAAVMIDDWKLPIFDEHLTRAGYVYTKGPGLNDNIITLSIETDDMAALALTIRAANRDAALRKLN